MFVPGVNGSIIPNAPSGSKLKGAYKNSKKRKMPNGGLTYTPYSRSQNQYTDTPSPRPAIKPRVGDTINPNYERLYTDFTVDVGAYVPGPIGKAFNAVSIMRSADNDNYNQGLDLVPGKKANTISVVNDIYNIANAKPYKYPGRKMPNGGVTSGLEDGTFSSPEKLQPVYIKGNTRIGNKEYTKRGTTADREMNTLTNAASKVSGFFGNMLSKFIGSSPQMASNVANFANVSGKVAEKVGDVSKEKIFNNYRPVSYPSVPEAIGGIFGKSAEPMRDQAGDYAVGEEAWRVALGLPTKSKYLTPSKYKPSNSNDPNAQYYSLNNVYDPQKLIDAYMQKSKGKPGKSIQMNSLAPFVSNPALNSEEMPFDQTDPLQKFKLSQGTDERGDYISLYDTYDFDLPLMDRMVYGSNRKPYDFYDRFYYKKDATGKPVYTSYKDGGKASNDKQMVDGVASILRRVEDKQNRLKLANQLAKQFNREKVKYSLPSFLAKSKVKK